MDDLGEGGGVAAGEEFFQGPAGGRFEVVGDELQHGRLLLVGGVGSLVVVVAGGLVGWFPVQSVSGVDAVAAGQDGQGDQADNEDQQGLQLGRSLLAQALGG